MRHSVRLAFVLFFLCERTDTAERINSTRVVKSLEHILAVHLADKTVDRYQIRWEGIVEALQSEIGSTPVPSKLKFLDDRQCQWTLLSRIERTVFYVRPSGRTLVDAARVAAITSPFATEGTVLSVTPMGESCANSTVKFEGDVNRVAQNMLEKFDAIVAKDLEQIKAELAIEGDVVEEGAKK